VRAFSLQKNVIIDALGLADEAGGDETAISSINVMLDGMFREASKDHNNLVIIHGEDLEKIHSWSDDWRTGAKTITTPKFKFKASEGISDEIMRNINKAPQDLAEQLGITGELTFCQTPDFWWERTKDKFEVCVWMHAIIYQGGVTNEQPKRAEVD
jgi:hypothetical protein